MLAWFSFILLDSMLGEYKGLKGSTILDSPKYTCINTTPRMMSLPWQSGQLSTKGTHTMWMDIIKWPLCDSHSLGDLENPVFQIWFLKVWDPLDIIFLYFLGIYSVQQICSGSKSCFDSCCKLLMTILFFNPCHSLLIRLITISFS